MNQLKNILLVIFGFFLVILTIRSCHLQTKLDEVIEDRDFILDHPITKTDTVWEYVEKPKPLPNTVKPKKIIYSHNQPGTTVITQMSADYSHLDSTVTTQDIVGVDLSNHKLVFTFSDPTLGLNQTEYQIKPAEYRYIWVDGKLTAKRLPFIKRIEFKPYASLSYRPFHNLLDMDLGINLKFRNVTYSIGGNLFYYPKFQTNPGVDVKLTLSCTF